MGDYLFLCRDGADTGASPLCGVAIFAEVVIDILDCGRHRKSVISGNAYRIFKTPKTMYLNTCRESD